MSNLIVKVKKLVAKAKQLFQFNKQIVPHSLKKKFHKNIIQTLLNVVYFKDVNIKDTTI